MKKITYILLLLLLVSCEREVDFPVDADGRIFIESLIGRAEGDRVNIRISQPAYGTESTSAEEVIVYLEADGNPVGLERDLEQDSDGGVSYILTEKVSPGQKLRLAAAAKGVPSVEAVTTVPEQIGDVVIDTRLAEVYKAEDPHQTINDTRELREFKISASGDLDKDAYFGVQVCKRIVYDTSGWVPPRFWEEYEAKNKVTEVDNLYVNGEHSEGIGISSFETEILVDFGGGDMRCMTPSDKDAKLIGEVYVKPRSSYMVESRNGYYYDPVLGDMRVNYEIYETCEYNVKVFRLSPEMYHYFKATHIIEWSDIPVHLGFSPVTYTYTNVIGGLGVFGAVSSYESGWFRIN